MNIMMERYEQVKEINRELRKTIEHTDLIKRGALLKIQAENEQKDKIYFAQMTLIYQQIDEIMNDINVSIEKKSALVHQLLNNSDYLTTKWENETRDCLEKMNKILYA